MNNGKIQWGKLFARLSPYNILKGIRYLRHYGFKEFFVRLSERFEPESVNYMEWRQKHQASGEDLEKQRKQNDGSGPLISIVVPAYHTPELYLRQLIESVKAQTYTNWELCFADGSTDDDTVQRVVEEYQKEISSIHYKRLKENLGIADNSNAAFEMAGGAFVGLLDHDDLLEPDILYEAAAVIKNNPQTDVIYTDEDKVTEDLGEYFQPHLKPDFNLDLLRSNNYICHFLLVRRELIAEVGGFRKEFDGAQDYDFIFRCTEKAREIHHIPRILYHWRIHKASTADNPMSKMYAFDAGKRAIEAHLQRQGAAGEVNQAKDLGFYQVRYELQQKPLVSIIIPNKDEKDTLEKCLTSILEKSSYNNYEIIIVENNSGQEETFRYYQEIEKHDQIRVVYWKDEFNYAAINNFGVLHAAGEFILFLNNDVEVISPDWMETMLANCQRNEVGIVGAKLYYPDDTVQHAGIVIGIGGIAGSLFVDLPRAKSGYLHKASIQQDLSAVTAACMMIKKAVFTEVGRFEEQLKVAFNDVDLCLKVRRAGYLVVYHPGVELYHYESKSRGAEDTKEKVRRFQSEIEYMRSHWINILKDGDPCYNPNLSLTKWDYSLKNF